MPPPPQVVFVAPAARFGVAGTILNAAFTCVAAEVHD
jgi:hypothetical protein